MATALRVSLLVAAIGLVVAGESQTAPPPPPGPVIVAPSPASQPTILKAVVPENVASAAERGGIVELFPWEVTESATAGTVRFPVSLPAQPIPPVSLQKVNPVLQGPNLPAGSIHILVTPPAAPAQVTPRLRTDHLDETIRKTLETQPQPK